MSKLKLRGTKPLIEEALEVGPKALLVYVCLWNSAEKHHEEATGGTTTWSHKALADKLRMSNTVATIQSGSAVFAARRPSSGGSKPL